MRNFDTIARKLPIPSDFVKHVNEFLTSNHISRETLVSQINKNEDSEQTDEQKADLPKNFWVKTDSLHEFVIILNLDYSTVCDILDKKLKVTNYTTMMSILYYMYRLAGRIKDEANKNALQFLQSVRVFTIIEKIS